MRVYGWRVLGEVADILTIGPAGVNGVTTYVPGLSKDQCVVGYSIANNTDEVNIFVAHGTETFRGLLNSGGAPVGAANDELLRPGDVSNIAHPSCCERLNHPYFTIRGAAAWAASGVFYVSDCPLGTPV